MIPGGPDVWTFTSGAGAPADPPAPQKRIRLIPGVPAPFIWLLTLLGGR